EMLYVVLKANIWDLGNSNIFGALGLELGELKHLQYLYILTNLGSELKCCLQTERVLKLVEESRNRSLKGKIPFQQNSKHRSGHWSITCVISY
ncbi:hypothetical protein M8C21_029136, partial [Ambrosia artemisiifolia]